MRDNDYSSEGHRDEIARWVERAIGGDVIADGDGGFVAVMAKGNPQIRQDIPAAFEMYTLLSHYASSLPLHAVDLTDAEVHLVPAILYDQKAGKVLALIPIGAGELDLVAYWVAGGIPSDTVRRMSGLLALPFSLETHAEEQHLIPEWFAVFYVKGSADHCVPSLTMRSVTADDRFGDWVAVALHRMEIYGLPKDAAKDAVQQVNATHK